MKSFNRFIKEASLTSRTFANTSSRLKSKLAKTSTSSGNLSDPQGDVTTSYNTPITGNPLLDRNARRIGGGRNYGYAGVKLAD